MSKIKVILVGESWVSSSTHVKGWDFFSSTVYETGVEYLEKALSTECRRPGPTCSVSTSLF